MASLGVQPTGDGEAAISGTMGYACTFRIGESYSYGQYTAYISFFRTASECCFCKVLTGAHTEVEVATLIAYYTLIDRDSDWFKGCLVRILQIHGLGYLFLRFGELPIHRPPRVTVNRVV